jgi:hypothetical protein
MEREVVKCVTAIRGTLDLLLDCSALRRVSPQLIRTCSAGKHRGEVGEHAFVQQEREGGRERGGSGGGEREGERGLSEGDRAERERELRESARKRE